jgi:hypothetical protein
MNNVPFFSSRLFSSAFLEAATPPKETPEEEREAEAVQNTLLKPNQTKTLDGSSQQQASQHTKKDMQNHSTQNSINYCFPPLIISGIKFVQKNNFSYTLSLSTTTIISITIISFSLHFCLLQLF